MDFLYDEVFVELRDLDSGLSRRDRAIEQSSEMRDYRSKKRNLLRVDTFTSWMESDSSQMLFVDGNLILGRPELSLLFTAPLLVFGDCNYETVLVLRHNCGDSPVQDTSCNIVMVQSLLSQIFEQHPKVLEKRKSALTREHTSDEMALWNIFVDCLEDVNADCTFILIDNIDNLASSSTPNVKKERLMLPKLDALIRDRLELTRILLTANLKNEQGRSQGYETALVSAHRHRRFEIFLDETAFIPYKFIDIQQRRCKFVSFEDLTMVYLTNTTIYTFQDGALRAFVVSKISGMEPEASGSYGALLLRVWSIDHNGESVARRYHDLVIHYFSNQKAINTLRYVPAGFLPDECEKRSKMIDRGRAWWEFSFGVHHVMTNQNKAQVRCDIPGERLFKNDCTLSSRTRAAYVECILLLFSMWRLLIKLDADIDFW